MQLAPVLGRLRLLLLLAPPPRCYTRAGLRRARTRACSPMWCRQLGRWREKGGKGDERRRTYPILGTLHARATPHSRQCSLYTGCRVRLEVWAVGKRNGDKARTDARCRAEEKGALLSRQMTSRLRWVIRNFNFLAPFRKPRLIQPTSNSRC
ncbi:hypothetical protein K438DRAFT_353363 [Mycena galopus ATCC 62051]|nr:hypothetical protein K438DRAFT_353363 [Mycena galopus ATCC 62051]